MNDDARVDKEIGLPLRPRVTVLVLNWNLWDMTVNCLQSLIDSDYDNMEIIVIDNGSRNDSAERISEWISETAKRSRKGAIDGCRVVVSKDNLGYPGGNNLGIRIVLEEKRADFILLMNNDVVVAPDAIGKLVHCATASDDFAFIGPKLLLMDSPGTVQCRGASVSKNFLTMRPLGYGEEDREDPAGITEVDAVYGACLLARISHLKDIGNLDEDFLFYAEDVEWCLRARRLGFKVGCVASAVVWHKSEASTTHLGAYRRFQAGRSRALLVKKYAPIHMRVLYVLLRLPKDLTTMMHADRDLETIVSFMKGFLKIYLQPSPQTPRQLTNQASETH